MSQFESNWIQFACLFEGKQLQSQENWIKLDAE